MAKFFIDVVQDSPRTGLGIPVKTKKNPLSDQYTAPLTRTVESARDAGPRVKALMRFLLAHPVVSLSPPIELSRLHHKSDE